MNENVTVQEKKKDDEGRTFTLGAVAPKRIWADCSAKDFNNFRDRARAEGFRTEDGRTDLAAAFAALVCGYAHGDVNIPNGRKQPKVRQENMYLKDHGVKIEQKAQT